MTKFKELRIKAEVYESVADDILWKINCLQATIDDFNSKESLETWQKEGRDVAIAKIPVYKEILTLLEAALDM